MPQIEPPPNANTAEPARGHGLDDALARARSLLEAGKTIVLYDGECNLCDASVSFLIGRDKCGQFYYAAQQSPLGAGLMTAAGIDRAAVDSLVVLKGDRACVKSDALHILGNDLGGAWAIAERIGRMIPRFAGDLLYDALASNRFRIFGRKDTCRLPTREERERFLDIY